MPAVFIFWLFLGAIVFNTEIPDGPNSGHPGKVHLNFGAHQICHRILGGHYNGYVYSGGNGKQAIHAKVPNCVDLGKTF